MKVDSPILTPLVLGVDKNRPEAGDSIIDFPPQVMPTVEPILPHRLVGSGLFLPNESASAQINANKNNVGGGSQFLIALPKGLFWLTLIAAVRFNYTSVTTVVPDVDVQILDGATGISYLMFFSQVGTFNQTQRYRILQDHQTSVRIAWQATGAAETLFFSVTAMVERMI